MALFRRKSSARGLTEQQMEAMTPGAVAAFRQHLRPGEVLDEESVDLCHPQAFDPSTGQWHEGPVNLVAVTSQVLVCAEPTSGTRNLEYDILGLDFFHIRTDVESIMIQFAGRNADLIQTIVLRQAGPADWPSMMRTTLLSSLSSSLVGAGEKGTGRPWDYVAMQAKIELP